MLTFVGAVGVADTCGRRERRDARGLPSTMFASVLLLLASFVKRMTALVRTIRMANAHGRRKARDRCSLVPAVFAIERYRFLRLRNGKHRHADYCQYRDGSGDRCIHNCLSIETHVSAGDDI